MVNADGVAVVAPKVLIAPTDITEDTDAVTGEIKVSGAKLHFFDGTNWSLITSA